MLGFIFFFFKLAHIAPQRLPIFFLLGPVRGYWKILLAFDNSRHPMDSAPSMALLCWCTLQPFCVKRWVILLRHAWKKVWMWPNEHLESFLEILSPLRLQNSFGKELEQTNTLLLEKWQPRLSAGWHQPDVPPPCFWTHAFVHLPNPELEYYFYHRISKV